MFEKRNVDATKAALADNVVPDETPALTEPMAFTGDFDQVSPAESLMLPDTESDWDSLRDTLGSMSGLSVPPVRKKEVNPDNLEPLPADMYGGSEGSNEMVATEYTGVVNPAQEVSKEVAEDVQAFTPAFEPEVDLMDDTLNPLAMADASVSAAPPSDEYESEISGSIVANPLLHAMCPSKEKTNMIIKELSQYTFSDSQSAVDYSKQLNTKGVSVVCNREAILASMIGTEFQLGVTLSFSAMCLTDTIVADLCRENGVNLEEGQRVVITLEDESGKPGDFTTYTDCRGVNYLSCLSASTNPEYLRSVAGSFISAALSEQYMEFRLIGTCFFKLNGEDCSLQTLRLNDYEQNSILNAVNTVISDRSLNMEIGIQEDTIVLSELAENDDVSNEVADTEDTLEVEDDTE